ncbi:uncharacterized protein LOC131430182 [Malaya genurostris]|uniref:uncharacterized protein LOC131430182 n=1 Tax=Malaya genurostris TaxID=325434 RepID=UPI0026F39980|nr:uncharacterized protein LOC131430182 [Malaya genurostris]
MFTLISLRNLQIRLRVSVFLSCKTEKVFINSICETKTQGNEAIVAFLDVKMAYDSVNTTKLLNILTNLQIPRKIISWLYEYLRHRVMRLETENGEIERVVSEGLPQGCPVSPILYNFYTAALHELSDDSCELVQFADDFAVIAKGDTLELAEQNLNRFLNKLADRLKELDLHISPQKSAVVPFTSKRVDHLRIKIGGQTVEIVNTHLYLGYKMDRTLRHRKHIEAVIRKASEKLNLLKLLAKGTEGANPETLIKVGNAIIRSRIEYGASSYGNAADTILNKLQVLQNNYIRIAMKYLRSTPVHVLLAESGQLPIKHRIEALTKKEMIRSMYHKTPLIRFISKTLSMEMPNGSFFSELAIKHMDVLYQVHPSDKSVAWETRMKFFHNFDLKDIVQPTISENDYKKTEHSRLVWQKLFEEVNGTKYKDHKRIYTDASKTPRGTAWAIYDEGDRSVIAENINNNYSIMNAELQAIAKAIEHAKMKNYGKTVVFTDSRSACKSLMNNTSLFENFIVYNIYKDIKDMRRGALKIQWIPSHTGIQGNEIADQAAVSKTYDKQTEHIGITLGDALALSQKEIWYDWSEAYKALSNSKGRWHYEILKTPERKIWFKDLTLRKNQIKILNRIRSGHTFTKERRALWRLEDDDCCEICLEREDLKHALYICPKYRN